MDELVFMKMHLFKLHFILFLLNFNGNHCQRRIIGGNDVSTHKTYVVYLLKADKVSPQNYEHWLCGGALISPDLIVTSAACVTDVLHLYAIAGYNKYINEKQINTDDCTKEKKKKVIYICIPVDYKLDYNKPEVWSNIDIAVLRVESPYDFADTTYADICSYTPSAIAINFDLKYQEPGIDAIVLGWGHKEKYRQEMDLENYNQELLQYSAVLIEAKKDCKQEYTAYPGMDAVIDKYMICTSNKGNLDDKGATINATVDLAEGCKSDRRLYSNLPECEKTDAKKVQEVKVVNTRKNKKPTNLTINDTERKLRKLTNSRRNDEEKERVGICQNDHGGPLVTWVGAHEVLIGVASVFKLSESRECIGPFLYTSTQCNGAFLYCMKNDVPNIPSRRAYCEEFVNETGYELFEKHISWKDHPDGPADNERNTTIHASLKNTTNNVTLNLKNSKEEGNETDQVQNTTTLVTNTNDTTPTLSTENSTFTRTTKADNIGDSTPINLTKTNTTKTVTVMSNSDTSVALENDTSLNESTIEQPTNYSTNKNHSIASKTYMFKDSDGRINTVLMARETNLTSTTITNITSTTTVNPGNTTTKKVNSTITVDVRTTKISHLYLNSATSNTRDIETTKPTRTTIPGLN